jgi:hypothetical protein
MPAAAMTRGRAAVSGLALLAAMMVTAGAWATAQTPDVVILNGREYMAFTNPLEAYLVLHPELRPRTNIVSTGCWRGYVATFELDYERLLLTRVDVDRRETSVGDDEYENVLSEVFPGKRRVFADWYTGYIVLPMGEQVEYVHLDYARSYERYTLLKIERGVMTERFRMDLEAFAEWRRSQFEAWQATEEYRHHFLRSMERNTWTEEEVRDFLYQVMVERYTSLIFEDNQ